MDDLARAIQDANRRLFQGHVQTGKMLHGRPPSCDAWGWCTPCPRTSILSGDDHRTAQLIRARPITPSVVVITSGGKGDRPAGSLDVKAPGGPGKPGPIRPGGASNLTGRSKCEPVKPRKPGPA